ncbi:MAG: LON peptidase substrate-binding domain-containing protein, partial [Gammaproteobacteria bacterium]
MSNDHDVPRAADAEASAAAGASAEGSPGAAAHTGSAPALPPDVLIIVPVRNVVLFHGTVFPITIGRERSILAAQQALREERQIGVLMQRDAELADPAAIDLHRTGTLANILRYVNAPDGSHHIVLQGEQRFRVVEFARERPFFAARVQQVETSDVRTPDIEARFLHLKQQALEALELLPQVPQELVGAVQAVASPGGLADLVAAYLDMTPDEKQEILETIDVTARMDKVSKFLAQRIEVLRLTQEIGRQTKATFDERQKEAILREQMATIQRQLGEGDGKSQEVAELAEAITKAEMPPEVEEIARKELRRYERMPEAAAEAGMVRTYLDWLIELPWAVQHEKPIDIADARRTLDEDHFGLEKIKRRIVEYLAVRKLAPDGKAPILCFVGPP